MLNEKENTVEDWLAIAENNLKTWYPDIFFDQLRTPIRNAYASLIQSPSRALGELETLLGSAKIREARPFHVMNIEAPGGCWELGTQINPKQISITAPSGFTIHTYAYRFIYLISYALVVDETDVVRHQCNNRACVRPDHLLLGTKAQNRLDDERRKYAGNSPQGRGQTLKAHITSHLQIRPDPWLEEPLERNETTDTASKTQK